MMAYIRYQSPNDTSFMVFDVSRFRVDHAIFLLKLSSVRALIEQTLASFHDYNLEVMKLVQEKTRLEACLEWLRPWKDEDESVLIPDLTYEAAIDRVADFVIGAGDFEKAFCLACSVEYRRDEVKLDPFAFEEDGVTASGHRTICPAKHTLHAVIELVDAPGLELD